MSSIPDSTSRNNRGVVVALTNDMWIPDVFHHGQLASLNNFPRVNTALEEKRLTNIPIPQLLQVQIHRGTVYAYIRDAPSHGDQLLTQGKGGRDTDSLDHRVESQSLGQRHQLLSDIMGR
jgi:hypothetical protein